MLKISRTVVVFSLLIAFSGILTAPCRGSETEEVKTDLNFTLDNYVGSYCFGTTPDQGPFGRLIVFPLHGNSYIFHLEVNRGKPTYNSGELNGKIDIGLEGKATYTFVDSKGKINCMINFSFREDTVIVRTDENTCDCGFGYAVIADGEYKRTSPDAPEAFIDRHGKTVFFKDLKEEMIDK